MTLTLYFHPFSSYCQKALLALYENETAFTPKIIDLSNAASAGELKAVWPIGKFPVLRDDARDETIAESSIIVEYLDLHYPGPIKLIPTDADAARQTRAWDRFFDFYINDTMSKVVTDHFRPAGGNDPHGVAQARVLLARAYDVLEQSLNKNQWIMGEAFSMADCAATPMLFYANLIIPLSDAHPRSAAYFDRLARRPAFMRILKDAAPYAVNGFPFAAAYKAAYGRITTSP